MPSGSFTVPTALSPTPPGSNPWSTKPPGNTSHTRTNPLAAWGVAGAYYLTEERRWIRRAVETIRYVDDAARRQLTIDLRLPRDPPAAVRADGDEWEYCIPVTLLAKERSVSWLDLRNEAGEVMPLLTDQESKAISASALMESARRLLAPTAPSPLLTQAIAGIGGRSGVVAASLFMAAAAEEGTPPLSTHKRLRQAVLDLSANRYVWLPLRGRPGEPRVIKISYRVAIGAEPSMAAMLGWTPFAISIQAPQLVERGEYHLQVCPPQGLEVCSIRLEADDRVSKQSMDRILANATLSPPDRRPGGDGVEVPLLITTGGTPLIPDVQLDAGRGHLRVNRAQANVDEGILASVAVRPQRRGVLTQASLASLLVAGMLWAYHGYSGKIENSETAAAVLLVVPALLALFSNAQLAEHPLTSRLLIALRGITLLSALLCGLAAAGLAGVKLLPDSLAGPLYAGLATVASALIAIAYLASFPWVERRVGDVVTKARSETQATWIAWRSGRLPSRVAVWVTAIVLGVEALVLLALALEWPGFGEGDAAAATLTAVTILIVAGGGAARRGLPAPVAGATGQWFHTAAPVGAITAAAAAGLIPAPELTWAAALSVLAAGLVLGVVSSAVRAVRAKGRAAH